MTIYAPILKGRAGEFEALQHASSSTLANIQPVIELLSEGVEAIDTDKLIHTFIKRIPGGTVVGVDPVHLSPAEQAGSSFRIVAEALQQSGIPIRPVVRIEDAEETHFVAREVAQLHSQGTVLRLGSVDHDPDQGLLEQAVLRTLPALGVTEEETDLLIDYGEVSSVRDIERIIPVATEIITWSQTRPWRSITLAAGAFPDSISTLPADEASVLPRFDAMLWSAVKQRSAVTDLGFGDYGVAHPAPSKGAARSPMPNLRYTTSDTWTVYRQATPKELGNERFYEICSKVIGALDWVGEDYSWGDGKIAQCAERASGPGNATKWRAYGTSHHLAVVTGRLATLGEP
ncbi:beta family protein [Streptosporangium algeriense]|uniref:Beta family protein n=1 Tax=Streptosporangium algeriense TaxID=1682748 RepID=A0ABW3DJS8_9ACTN